MICRRGGTRAPVVRVVGAHLTPSTAVISSAQLYGLWTVRVTVLNCRSDRPCVRSTWERLITGLQQLLQRMRGGQCVLLL